MTRLQDHYQATVRPLMQSEFNYRNVMEVPRLEKVVVNMGVGEAVADSKKIDNAAKELTLISGQKPIIIKAKKSVATFKLREGMPIGAMVTMRGNRMFEFIDRLISSALPRVRDFKGVSDKGFDGRGNFSMGLNDQTIFPEIDIDKVDKVKGMTITVVTTARTDSEGLALLRALGMPFRKN